MDTPQFKDRRFPFAYSIYPEGHLCYYFLFYFFFFPWEEYSVSTTHSVVVKSLRRLYLLDFQLFVQGIQLMSLPVCFHAHKNPSKKRSTLLGKNLLPRESKFFPSRVDPFSEGRQKKTTLTELSPMKVQLFPLK